MEVKKTIKIGSLILLLLSFFQGYSQTKQKKESFFIHHNTVSIPSNFINPEDCTTGGNNGEIDISVSGGSGNYSFAWKKDGIPGFSTNEDLFGLVAGDYEVVVTDVISLCTFTESYVVDYTCPYTCSGVSLVFTNATNASCGNATGVLEADVFAGEFTYELWKVSRYSGSITTIVSGTDTGPTTLTFSSLSAGEYELFIEETISGCTYSDNAIVGAIDLAFVTTNFVNNSSCTAVNGQVDLSIQNLTGVNSFVYKLKNSSTGVETIRSSASLNETFSNLVAGFYLIELTDAADGCAIETEGLLVNTVSLAISLNSTTDQTSCSTPNGGADISVTGGTGNYNFFWSSGATTEDITNVPGRTYSISVFDQTSGCRGNRNNIAIAAPPRPNLSLSFTNNTNCSAPYNGSIDLTVTGTPGPHVFEWTNMSNIVISTVEDPTGLAPDAYGVKVTNQPSGCSRTISVSDGVFVDDVSTPSITINTLLSDPNTLCTTSPGNGAISVTIDAGGFPYSTTWTSTTGFSASGVEDLVNLATGDYELTVEVVCSGNPPALASPVTSRNYTGTELVINDLISVADTDSPNLQSAIISFHAGHLASEDELLFTDQAGLTGMYNSVTGVLTVSGSASLATYQTALRSVRYRNLANPRSKNLRTIEFQVSDGAFLSTVLLTEILFPNQAPVISGTPPLALYGTGEYLIFPTALVTDDDDINLASAQVSIATGFQAGSDELLFDNQPGITGAYSPVSGVLTFTGLATAVNYQQVLRSVRFRNLTTAINPATRQIQFSISDGLNNSNTIPASIPINQPPEILPAPVSFSGKIISIDLSELMSDPNNNLDASTLVIVSPPQSGAIASLNGTILLLDYTSLDFSGMDQLGISVCDLLGACATRQLTIQIDGLLEIFNAVSANGDNLNSFFFLRNIKPGNRVTIFNRWGDVVYETADYDNQDRKFTGLTTAGKQLPSGIYFYRIESINSPALTGFLSLKQ
jgi:gliding motility-associated-like protein